MKLKVWCWGTRHFYAHCPGSKPAGWILRRHPHGNIPITGDSDAEDFLLNSWPQIANPEGNESVAFDVFSWAVRKKHATVNATREVKVKKPKKRYVYIRDDHFMAIREWILKYSFTLHEGTPQEREVTGSVPTGPMMQCMIDACYLTCQRSTDLRTLTWQQIDNEASLIHFLPSKTKDSSGEAVDWPLTPYINAVLSRAKLLTPAFGQKYVIRDRRGNPKTDQACRDAWEGATARAGHADKPYTINDIRAKAMTDAKRAGYDLDALQVAGAHTDRSTTQGYIKSSKVPVSTVVLHLPQGDAA